ncbi:hypothetical protein V6Z11_A05G253400 [Gossypium hirsutum]
MDHGQKEYSQFGRYGKHWNGVCFSGNKPDPYQVLECINGLWILVYSAFHNDASQTQAHQHTSTWGMLATSTIVRPFDIKPFHSSNANCTMVCVLVNHATTDRIVGAIGITRPTYYECMPFDKMMALSLTFSVNW